MFIFETSHGADFWSAQQTCQEWGGELASINTQEEQDAIFSMVDPSLYYWIGFHDTSHEGNFEWSDGSDVTYTNWGWGEPNQWMGTEEDCTTFWNANGNWNDWDCSNEIGFICKAVWSTEEERLAGVKIREE